MGVEREKELVIKSVGDMHAFAASVVSVFSGGGVLLLSGDLGTGKTTFVQGLARALGVKEDVSSPTFTIISEYGCDGRYGIDILVHIDLYRLDGDEVGKEGAVREALKLAGEEKRLTAIEWAEKLGDLQPVGAENISFAHGSQPGDRVVILK